LRLFDHRPEPKPWLIWINSLCAAFLVTGIYGAAVPNLTPRPFKEIETPVDFLLPVPARDLPAPHDNPPDQAAVEPKVQGEDQPASLPVPVPYSDPGSIRSIDSPFNPERPGNLPSNGGDRPSTGSGPGGIRSAGDPVSNPATQDGTYRRTRYFTDNDVDRGRIPTPRRSSSGTDRLLLEPGTVIRIQFGKQGQVVQAEIIPNLVDLEYQRQLLSHIRRHWRSKIGPIRGDWPLNQQN